MARREDRGKAIALRLKGYSYSQIKKLIGLSKSTLSCWLSDYPLSNERIQELRGRNPARIEKFRNTMRAKRDSRLSEVYKNVSSTIGELTKREMLIAGLFLYWGEGGKTQRTSVALTNTNPAMLKFFIRWLKCLGINKEKLKVNLHLYSDMDKEKEISFWSQELGLLKSQFRNPYIKTSRMSDITYKNGFGHGTCSLIFQNRDIGEYVLSGVKYLETL